MWEVLFETQDEREFRAYLLRLRDVSRQIDFVTLRVDTLCGHLQRPTTYRLSRFVPNDEREASANAGERSE